MRRSGYSLALAIAVILFALSACGPTAAEQHVADQQRCGGFGFQSGTDGFASCMMSLSQQRNAQAAADQRAYLRNQAIADQAQKDRDAAAAAAAEADDRQKDADFQARIWHDRCALPIKPPDCEGSP